MHLDTVMVIDYLSFGKKYATLISVNCHHMNWCVRVCAVQYSANVRNYLAAFIKKHLLGRRLEIYNFGNVILVVYVPMCQLVIPSNRGTQNYFEVWRFVAVLRIKSCEWHSFGPSKCLFTLIRPKNPSNEITWHAKSKDTHMIRLNPWPHFTSFILPHSLAMTSIACSGYSISEFSFSYMGCGLTRYWHCANRINTLASESICLGLGRVYCLLRWIIKCSESTAELFPFYCFGYSFAHFFIPYYFSSPYLDPAVFFLLPFGLEWLFP